ncbi:MAG: hypothetical protein OXI79_19060 [Gammaproteobacteria bacterium]|nr:hypothetical protein [Gammaproteobacteria bacterium]
MSTNPHTRPKLLRRFLKANAATLAGSGGYVIALGVAFASIGVSNTERGASAMARYGNTVAEDLAHHAVEPLLRRDRIQLGLLTNRLVARPEVRSIAIGTVDERLFVVAGRPASAAAATYVRPIMVEDTVAGDVTVTLNTESFMQPLVHILRDSWQYVLAGLAFTVFVFHFATHLGSPRSPAPAPRGGPRESPPKAFVVAANLPLRSVSQAVERERLLAYGMAVAARVANLYAGHAAALPGSGIVLVFPVSGSSDRCFEVVCAALLTQRLLSANASPVEPDPDNAPDVVDSDAADPFRYGFDYAEAGIAIHGDSVKASAVANVTLLASLAGAGELVLGQAAFETLDRPERVEIEQLENPAAEALSSEAAMPRGKIRGIASEYDTLLTRQTEVIANASAPPR